MGFDTMLWLLALIAAVGTGGFYAGWRAAAAYLNAAMSVSEIASSAVQQSNTYSSSLDKSDAALSSLAGEVKALSKVVGDRHTAIETALLALFDGLERSGLARSSKTRSVPKQVGESDSEG
jgi:hypothetical protein